MSLACAGVTPRPNDPNRPRLGLLAAVSVMVSPTGRVMRLFQRQQHDEAGIARHRLHAQIPTMFLHDDVPRQIQPEAGALADWFGGEERLEDVLAYLLGDTGPGVADLDAGQLLAFPTSADGQSAALVAHRCQRVVDDVGPDLVEIAWKARDFGKRLVEFLDHCDRAGVLAAVFA